MAIQLASKVEPIPGYTLVEHLGTGGFGEVWKAIAPGGIPKAIKFIKGSLDDIGDGAVPAVQELKALNRVKNVHHPFILGMERVDIIDGQVMIVMELADKNLMDRVHEYQAKGLAGIPRVELLRYMGEVAEALDLMNTEYQLQHLDIKPQNLFLVHNHVKVADFGLVKDLEGKTATITSGITPVYAAPEAFEGKVTHFSDQYSFAIVYQELLTGHRPFNGTNARQLLMQHMRGKPDLTALPPGDRTIVARALAKVPGERFGTCMEFVNALRRAPNTPVAAPPPAKQPPASDETETRAHPGAIPRSQRPGLENPQPRSADAASLASHKAARPTGLDFQLPPDQENRPRLVPDDGSQSIHRPQLASSSDTVEMGPTSKSPTVRIDKKDVAARQEVLCPRCNKPLIDAQSNAWCAGCGYTKDAGIGKTLHELELKDKEQGLAELISEVPKWPFALLMACLALVVATAYRNQLIPVDSQIMFWLATALGAVGLGIYVAGNCWIVRCDLRHQEIEFWKYLDPSTVWPRAITLLPDTKWPICLGGLGSTAMVCALVVIFMNDASPRARQVQASSGVVVDLPAGEQRTETAYGSQNSVAQFDVPNQERTEKSQSTRCVVLGYVSGVSGRVSELILGREEENGRIQFAGTVKVAGESTEVEKLHQALSGAPKGKQLDKIPSQSNATWIETKYACTVLYGEQDSGGVLKDPVLKTLTLRK